MKYRLTDKTIEYNGTTLYQIQATKDFTLTNGKKIKSGDLGGWIEKESNLSQYDNCWVYGNAKVWGDAEVWGNAKVWDNVEVFGNADVSNTANIWGNAEVYGDAQVYDDAKVSGNAKVYDNAIVYDDARVCGNAWVYGNAMVCGNAMISNTKDYLQIGPLGSNRFLTITKSNGMIQAGCFLGTLDKFKKSVDLKYKGKGDYYWAIKAIYLYLND